MEPAGQRSSLWRLRRVPLAPIGFFLLCLVVPSVISGTAWGRMASPPGEIGGAPPTSQPLPAPTSVPGPSGAVPSGSDSEVSTIASTVQSSIEAPGRPAVSGTGLPLTLTTTVTPPKICAYGVASCDASSGTARVTLEAAATVAPTPFWPNVQIAFVIETTAYDGVYYHYFGYPGTDPCADANNRQGLPCEESNGVPFFEANAGEIASAIQDANPHSKVSFAMVDFFGTDCGDWNDCGDSEKYHVDIPSFVPAASFGSTVTQTLKDGVFAGGYAGIVGLDDNFLHSPSITALYGAVIGSGLNWAPNTHHVIVLIGSTAPRAPGYDENYFVSSFDPCCASDTPLGWTCEPSYTFTEGTSPNCEGWVASVDGNPNASIAALTKTSPTCTDSVGHTCTIDVIDLWDTATDPYSEGWPLHPAYSSGTANGPGAPRVIENVDHVLAAGCALAAATGGSWDGPAYWTCPNGQEGTLEYVPHGSYSSPNTVNPTLFAALRQISFGPVLQTLAANGTSAPMFSYVPIGSIQLAPRPDFKITCETPTGPFPTCQQTPTNATLPSGVTYPSWNWSTNPKENALYVGDVWTASFDVVATGPPFDAEVPVDACTTSACRVAGSGPVNGHFTQAVYRPAGNTSADNVTLQQSFPPGTVEVEVTAPPVSATGPPPPPPPAPPGLPVTAPLPVPVTTAVGIGNSVGIANVSLQGVAAGLLGSGFVRVHVRNRPIANPVLAAKAKAAGSKFDGEGMSKGGVGKFE